MYESNPIPNELLNQFNVLIKQQLLLATKNIQLYVEMQNRNSSAIHFIDITSISLMEQMDKYVEDCNLYSKTVQEVKLLMGDIKSGKTLFCQYLIYRQLRISTDINFIPIYIDLNKIPKIHLPFIEIFLRENYQLNDKDFEVLKKLKVVFIFDHYAHNGQKVNLFVTQQLDQWNAKCIIVTDNTFLKQFKDYKPCFVPYFKNKRQLALFSELSLPIFSKTITNNVNITYQTSADNNPEIQKDSSRKYSIRSNNVNKKIPIKNYSVKMPSPLEELLDHPLNRVLIVNDLNIIKLLVDQIKVDDAFISFLFRCIYGSRHEPQLAVAAANAITALNYARVSFSGLDFSYINIPFADLRDAMLHATNLSYANLYSVKLQNVFLYDANLEGCDLTKAEFEQQPHLFYQGLVVTSLSYSENRIWLAAGGTDNSVCVWHKLNDGYSEPLVLLSHTDWAESVVFSSDNQYLISGSRDKSIIIWQTSNFEPLSTLNGHTDWVGCVAVSNNSKFIASASNDKTVKLWDLQQHKLINTLEKHTDWVTSVAISMNNELIASAGRDKKVCVWNIKDSSLHYILEGHTAWINSIAFTKDNLSLASAGEDLTVHIWQLNNGKLRTKYTGHLYGIRFIAISNDNRFLAVATDYSVWLWSIEDDALKRIFFGQVLIKAGLGVKSIAFSPDNQWMAVGLGDCTIRFWQLKTEIHHPIHQNIRLNDLECLAFDHTNQFIAVGGWDGSIRLWHIKSGKLLKTLEGHDSRVITLQFNNDNITSIEYKKHLLIRSCTDNSIINKLTLPEPQSIYGVSISADNQYLATISKDKQQVIMLWRKNIDSYSLQHTLEKHDGWITCLEISRDKKWLASGSVDKNLKIWRISNGILQYSFCEDDDYINCIAISTDSQFIASGSFTNKIWIYSLFTGKVDRILQIESDEKFIKGKYWTSCLAFSEDNQLLAAGNSAGQLNIWSVRDSKLQQSINLFCGIIKIAFSSDNKQLAIASSDRSLKLFNLKQTDNGIFAYFNWLSHKYLTLFQASMKNVKGISSVDEQLLTQHDAIHVPRTQKYMPYMAFFQNRLSKDVNSYYMNNQNKIKRMLRWIYNFEPVPGLRVTKYDGVFWYEEGLIGVSTRSQIVKENDQIEVKYDENETHTNSGTLIRVIDTIDFQIFIPGVGSKEMYMWCRHNHQNWSFLNVAEEVDMSADNYSEKETKMSLKK